jgi:hypothetical protein
VDEHEPARVSLSGDPSGLASGCAAGIVTVVVPVEEKGACLCESDLARIWAVSVQFG